MRKEIKRRKREGRKSNKILSFSLLKDDISLLQRKFILLHPEKKNYIYIGEESSTIFQTREESKQVK